MPLTQVSSRAIEDTLRYVLGASGTNHYTFTGKGLTGAVNDPTLTLSRGHTYIFENRNSSNAHPFYIKTSIANGGTNDAYNTGVTNNGGAGGTEIVFTVPHDAPDTLYYQCSSHSSMAGQLNIAGSVADGSITTAKLADNAVGAAQLANNSVDNNALQSLSVTAAKIASGEVSTAKIADQAITLDKLPHGTSSNDGKFLRANNGADPTFETVTSFSDDKIVNDISALALKVNAIENATRYNTNSTSVETFQDANGIASLTNAVRNATGEYISTFVAGTFGTLTNFVAANWNYGNLQAWSAGTATFSHGTSPDEDGMGQTMGASSEISFPANTPFRFSLVGANASGYGPWINIQLTSNSDTGTVANTTNFRTDGRRTANSVQFRLDVNNNGLYFSEFNNSGTENSIISNGTDMTSGSTTLIERSGAGIFKIYKDGSLQGTSTHAITGAMQIAIGGTGGNGASASSMQYSVGTAESLNATGNFISNVITASASTSKMGVVVTYIDHAGTATLNTDLKVSVSADNGSNFTQVTLVAQSDFATGVKMAKANDVTVTAGTQLKYKVEFANQAKGSKETRVTGISLQF